ncbi:hypothetical protein [Thermospira aquatica]|uniref:Uncharacterized protein n=1 Tax=Thermospira aquatica TaxID=2828656 RepID=A0AAX3BAB4_9SPIR|nr:hypothetical protein [Thermospira aquatica]URA09136.1 hypothetical protein KDW03_06400 [Thermospira aquatica]
MDSIQVSSLWRNSTTSPHGSGRGIDIVAATRGDVTVRFNNTPAYANQYDQNTEFIEEVYTAFYNDPRVSQVLNPSRMLSRDPNNYYDEPNIWNQPKPQKVNSKFYRLMIAHNNHLHITIWRQ